MGERRNNPTSSIKEGNWIIREKMKIGILTLPFNWNYGGILQAFALQSTLNSMGHKVVLISRRKNRATALKRFPVWFKWKMVRAISCLPFTHFVPLFAVEPFKKKYFLNITSNIFTDKAMTFAVKKESPDAIIVGSDQIWNSRATPNLYNAYLDFAEEMSDIKKLSYAASFGMDKWLYSKADTAKCRQLIQQFHAVSVREDSGVTLCKKYLNVDACHLVDPTMLLSKETYLQIINMAKTHKPEKQLLNYMLDESEDRVMMINTIQRELKMTSYSIKPEGRLDALRKMIAGEVPSVEQWLRNFSDAEFIITDSFHGTVFSIIFNKPFDMSVN